jgi:hypothetical protein
MSIYWRSEPPEFEPGKAIFDFTDLQAAKDQTPSRGPLCLANTPTVLYLSRHLGSSGAVRSAGEVAMKFTLSRSIHSRWAECLVFAACEFL